MKFLFLSFALLAGAAAAEPRSSIESFQDDREQEQSTDAVKSSEGYEDSSQSYHGEHNTFRQKPYGLEHNRELWSLWRKSTPHNTADYSSQGGGHNVKSSWMFTYFGGDSHVDYSHGTAKGVRRICCSDMKIATLLKPLSSLTSYFFADLRQRFLRPETT